MNNFQKKVEELVKERRLKSFDSNAIEILKKRYVNKGKDGKPTETVEDILPRVIEYVCQDEGEEFKEDMFSIFTNLLAMPSTPILMNAGTGRNMLSACFVLGIEDDTDSIYDNLKYQAQIHRTGGGTGFDFSRIRPKGDIVSSTGGAASGPISYLKVYNQSTETIKQGGKRRGANMGILRVDHPDIREWIQCKLDNNEVENFNLSVGITNEFMEAVFHDDEYELVNPRDGAVWHKEKARDIMHLIAKSAHKNGEPGVVFLDRINGDNPILGLMHAMRATNPCGEQPLEDNESCNLLSINVARFFNPRRKDIFEYELLDEVVAKSVTFMDNVLDKNNYPYDFIKEKSLANRKIGIGIMGFADLLIKMNMRYGSDASVAIAEILMRRIQKAAHKQSRKLAEERGVFPNYDISVYAELGTKMRNATLTTIAPTGTISILCGTSGGIEPYPFMTFIRKQADLELFDVAAPLKEWLMDAKMYNQETLQTLYEKGVKHFDIKGYGGVDVYVDGTDVTAEEHLKIMKAFQANTDNAISKTVILPFEATVEEVERIYLDAYRMRLKGVTVYRDGSRESQPLVGGKTFKNQPEVQIETKYIERDDVTYGSTEEVKIGCGELYVTVNRNQDGKIVEVFTTTGKHGGCPSQSEGLARMISISLRSGVPMEKIIKQLQGIRCFSCIAKKDVKVLSCPDAIARVLKKANDVGEIKTTLELDTVEFKANLEKLNEVVLEEVKKAECPECGSEMYLSEGCTTCTNPGCGYSKCG